MKFADYLKQNRKGAVSPNQERWTAHLKMRVKEGWDLYHKLDPSQRMTVDQRFSDKSRTEELKAWYSEPEGDSLFQGTSVTSLTIPFVTGSPLNIGSMEALEDHAAEAYIQLHRRHEKTVASSILENVGEWLSQGLYYGMVMSSKVISQAFGLSVPAGDVIFEVEGQMVDPHEITTYSQSVRRAYFEKCKETMPCFEGIKLEQREIESSLVLADISKPKLKDYHGRILLAPPRCNDIAAALSNRIAAKIRDKSNGKINIRSLAIIIYDTDTPYTYHRIMGFGRTCPSPVLPGLTVLGASGSIDAFRWLYTYRVSLLAQKIQKGSLYSEAHKKFMPFVFFGVLVPRDAEILLDMDNLNLLRYNGNISPELEYMYIIPSLVNECGFTEKLSEFDDFMTNNFGG